MTCNRAFIDHLPSSSPLYHADTDSSGSQQQRGGCCFTPHLPPQSPPHLNLLSLHRRPSAHCLRHRGPPAHRLPNCPPGCHPVCTANPRGLDFLSHTSDGTAGLCVCVCVCVHRLPFRSPHAQDHSSDVHAGGSEGKGHIQVIAADHTSSLGQDDPQQQQQQQQQHQVHLYYPNR